MLPPPVLVLYDEGRKLKNSGEDIQFSRGSFFLIPIIPYRDLDTPYRVFARPSQRSGQGSLLDTDSD